VGQGTVAARLKRTSAISVDKESNCSVGLWSSSALLFIATTVPMCSTINKLCSASLDGLIYTRREHLQLQINISIVDNKQSIISLRFDSFQTRYVVIHVYN
jgi:hypothetical protein